MSASKAVSQVSHLSSERLLKELGVCGVRGRLNEFSIERETQKGDAGEILPGGGIMSLQSVIEICDTWREPDLRSQLLILHMQPYKFTTETYLLMFSVETTVCDC